jgi:hypothetical protein
MKAECDSQCIRGGAYCCPDPDDNILEGYSGADVLKVGARPSWLGACVLLSLDPILPLSLSS